MRCYEIEINRSELHRRVNAADLEYARMRVVSAHLKLHMAVMDSMFEAMQQAMK